MVPETFSALLALLAFVAPGLVFELLRERRRPYVKETSFREAARIALTSFVFTGVGVLVASLVRWARPSWVLEPAQWLEDGRAYAADHLGLTVRTLLLVLAAALLAAFATDASFRRRASGRIVSGSVWFTLFRQRTPRGARPWVHVKLVDETEVWGYAGDYTPDPQMEDRELVIEGPSLQYRRKGQAQNTVLPDWPYLTVRGESVVWMKVQYVIEGADGESVLVPPTSGR